jgi:hypothetical protein
MPRTTVTLHVNDDDKFTVPIPSVICPDHVQGYVYVDGDMISATSPSQFYSLANAFEEAADKMQALLVQHEEDRELETVAAAGQDDA